MFIILLIAALMVGAALMVYFRNFSRSYPVIPISKSAVVLTGCSSGIGLCTAHLLAGRGFLVFAGVRREADFDIFSTDSIVPVLIDIADSNSIAAAAKFVSNYLKERHLGKVTLSIVNNAGVGSLSAVQDIDLATLRSVLDVNVVGAVDMVQQFLPLVVDVDGKYPGRIVNVGSGKHESRSPEV